MKVCKKSEGLKCREFVAGGTAELDVYEGMTHVFQSYMMNTPEQKAAYAEMKNFSARNLHPAKR